MRFEEIEKPKMTSLEDSNIEHVSADQYPDIEYITAKSLKTLSGYFANLKFLFAPDIVSLEPDQVPKLQSLNASYSPIDICLRDFPSLLSVYCHADGWKCISEEMRVRGWRYKNGKLTQPLNEMARYNINSLLGKNKGDFVSSLVEIYGERIRDVIRDIEKKNPNISPEKIIKIIEARSTCESSSFFREPNIQVLAKDIISQDKEKEWEILCVGCADGPEPHQLGIHLMENKVNFHIDGIDINSESIEKAKSGIGKINHDNNFFEDMSSKNILKCDYDKKEYKLSDELVGKMDFKQHDIISGPAEKQKQYDVAVCNNVLQHFPKHTRELILTNILTNMEDGGILALENNHLEFKDDEEKKWLSPYYKWKKDLACFGLTAKKIENKYTYGKQPIIVFQYNKKGNKFRDKNFAIRNKKLTEIPMA